MVVGAKEKQRYSSDGSLCRINMVRTYISNERGGLAASIIVARDRRQSCCGILIRLVVRNRVTMKLKSLLGSDVGPFVQVY